MIKKINIKIILTLFLSLAIILAGAVSCSSPQEEQAPPAAEQEQQPQETEEGQQPEEEIVEVIEEQVDYDAVNVAAELKGYIPSYLCLDKDNYIKIEITNNSDFTWKKDGQHMVRIGYHYYHKQTDSESYDNPTRTPLEQDLKPGETATVEVLINNISQEGDYIFRLDPVLEGKYWFSTKGVEMLEGEVYFGPCSN